MRLLLLLFQFLITISIAQAQSFNPKAEWFDLIPFFSKDTIKSKEISTIYISIQSKKDGKKISEKSQFLRYNFDDQGNLIRSQKSVPMSNRIDTSEFNFSYNKSGLLKRRDEKQGQFNFSYLFMYNGNNLKKEIKIDNKSNDTLYLKEFKTIEYEHVKITNTLNDHKVPYKQLKKEYDTDGKIILSKTTYNKTQNYLETSYKYIENILEEINHTIYFNKKKTNTLKFNYFESNLAEVEFYEDSLRVKKYAILYNENNLEQTVIERDYINSNINIYNIYYTYSYD